MKISTIMSSQPFDERHGSDDRDPVVQPAQPTQPAQPEGDQK